MALFSKKKTDLPNRRQNQSSFNRVTSDDLEQRYNFRRNQTLTGSTSSQVNSAAENVNSHLKSARTQSHELTRQRRHIGFILFIVIVVAIGLYILVTQFTAGVNVSIEDVESTPAQRAIYAQSVQKYFADQPFQRLRFLINQNQLVTYLQSVDPEVASASVAGSAGLGSTVITIQVRKPIAVWDINSKEEYVDSDGISFERNYYANPTVQIIDQSGVELPPGQAVASSSFFSFVGRLVGFSDKRGLDVQQVIIPHGTTHQVQLRISGVSYPIIFSVDRPAGDQVEDMATSISWFKSHSVSPQYLDVRVSGRAYYK